MQTHDEFVPYLHDALRHLYDPDALRASPLIRRFRIEGRPNAFAALQSVLTQAIAQLEPAPDEPPESPLWEVYELLFYRYVQQLPQTRVARQLGMSVRHLRRKEHMSLEVLAAKLSEQFPPEPDRPAGNAPAEETAEGGAQDEGLGPQVSDELAWLRGTPAEHPADLQALVPEVYALVGRMAAARGVALQVDLPTDLPSVAAHPVALRQMLLNVLVAAIHSVPGGRVCLSVAPTPPELIATVRACGGQKALSADDVASLSLAGEMAEMCGGSLAIVRDEAAFCAEIRLPAQGQITVLAIDDNADTLQLLRRYTRGTRYHLVDTCDPASALSLALETRPEIIVLDVMMPRVDGWHVLAQLVEHPITRGLPIVVCTIVAQEEIALSLGASALVRKPVTRAAFLEALDEQVAALETRSS